MSLQASAALRRIAPVALAAAIIAAPASAATAGCAPAGAKVLASSGAARLYSSANALYGCVGKRRSLLGSLTGTHAAPATRVARYLLAGDYAGIDTVQMGVDNLAATLTLVDLQTGATLAHSPATTGPPEAESFSTVTALAVNSNGILAWIGKRSAVGHPTAEYELFIATRTHTSANASATVPLTHLQLTNKTLSYTLGPNGKRFTIPLADPTH
jgi:hypothetical protein